MQFIAALCITLLLLLPAGPAHADLNTVAAREVARNNNCAPKSVAVYRASVGSEFSTIYRVDCTMPKVTDEKAPKGADALLIQCRDNLCSLVRPMSSETK